ncbi:hypothetical protein ACVIIW_003633 [Bradyrhizobium sp. USDA 4449]
MTARLCLAFIAVFAIAWGVIFCPIADSRAEADRVARRIVLGEVFKPSAMKKFGLLAEDAEREPSCVSSAIRSAAIIRIRLLEDAMANADRAGADAAVGTLQSTIQRSLSCSPHDPFLWFVLYWLKTMQEGFQPEVLEYLRKSYELGPFEGWIGVKRNGLALAVFEELPPDLAEKVAVEFSVLLNSGFVAEMVTNLCGPGWPARHILVSHLGGVRDVYRTALANQLRKSGCEVQIPGIELKEIRPWTW